MRRFFFGLLFLGVSFAKPQYPNNYPQNVQSPRNPNYPNQNQNPNLNQNQNPNLNQNQNQNSQNIPMRNYPNANPNYQAPNNQNLNVATNNAQFQNQQYQNQYPNGQQYQRPNGFINTGPLRDITPDPTQQNQTGAIIQLQLKTYSDPNLRLPGGMTCACPQGMTCPYLRTTESQCYFSFTTIISAPDQSVQYIATEFVPLNINGQIDLTRATANWSTPQTFYLSSKPSAIDIFVHHLGVVIEAQTGALKFFNNLIHVDTFVQPLTNYVPTLNSQSPVMTSVQMSGLDLGTSMSLDYSVRCLNNYIGPNCDMTCTTSTVNSQNAVCYSNVTGFYSVCSYQTGGQVTNCQPCQNGVSNGQCSGTVQVAQGGVVESSSFRTWTIVLGCLFGLALIFIIALIVFIIIAHNKEAAPAYRAAPPPTNTWSKPAAARPLLSDPYPSKAEQNSQDWGYQPHVVSVNNQRSAPIADHEASRQSQSTNDDQNSHSSYNTRPANGNPVALARREAQV